MLYVDPSGHFGLVDAMAVVTIINIYAAVMIPSIAQAGGGNDSDGGDSNGLLMRIAYSIIGPKTCNTIGSIACNDYAGCFCGLAGAADTVTVHGVVSV